MSCLQKHRISLSIILCRYSFPFFRPLLSFVWLPVLFCSQFTASCSCGYGGIFHVVFLPCHSTRCRALYASSGALYASSGALYFLVSLLFVAWLSKFHDVIWLVYATYILNSTWALCGKSNYCDFLAFHVIILLYIKNSKFISHF